MDSQGYEVPEDKNVSSSNTQPKRDNTRVFVVVFILLAVCLIASGTAVVLAILSNGGAASLESGTYSSTEGGLTVAKLVNETEQLKLKLAKVESESKHLSAELKGRVSGSTYVRWGRKSCDGNVTMLYSGLAAGQHFNSYGGASNYQCLPSEPEYSKYVEGDQNGFNYIHGAEYQTGSGIFASTFHDQNVPCARCYIPTRSTTLMIPAQRNCPPSWIKEYEGYLMSGHYSDKRAYNYVCMDKDPEALTGLQADTNGAVFFFVQGYCPTLGQCPPYISGAELACVVCTK